jgi:hypothetical protein
MTSIRRGSVIRTDRFRSQILKATVGSGASLSPLHSKSPNFAGRGPQARLLLRLRLALRLRKSLLPRRRSFVNRRQVTSPRRRRRDRKSVV